MRREGRSRGEGREVEMDGIRSHRTDAATDERNSLGGGDGMPAIRPVCQPPRDEWTGRRNRGRARERSRGALVTRTNHERTESLDGMERPERKQSRLLPPSTDPILSRPHSVRRWHRTGGQPGIHPGEEEGLGAKVGRRPQRAATEKSSESATNGSREELSLPTLPGCGRRTGRVAQPR